MKNTLIILCLLTMFSLQTLAQIGIGTTSPDVSAMLDVQSSARGLLAPRMTTYERTGIISPADGLLVYDTDSHSFWFYKNDVWSEFLGNTSGWSLSGNSLAGTEFLGSTNNQPVKFYSNNIERMRIDENGLIGINTSPVSGFRFTVNENSTNVSTSSIGISSRMNLNPAGNQTGFTWNMPLYTNLQITGNTNTMISVGSNTVVQNFSTGSASAQYGLIAQNEKHSNSSVGTLTGALTSAGVTNGTATDVIGGDFYTSANNAASVTNLYAAKVSNYLGGSAMIGTLEGLDVIPAIPSGYSGTVTNAYGIRIRELTLGTNRVALAYDHPTSPFVVKGLGDVGIGTSSPSTRLHVVATSNPLRLEGLQTGTSTDVLVADATGVVQKRADLSGMKFGDATNYATFEADGTLVFNGTATTFNDFVVPLNTAKAGGNSPTWEKFRDNGSGSVGVFTWTFADVGTNSENEIHFTVQMPHGWKEGSTIEPHIHWAPMTNGSGVVRWGLEYTWVDYEGNFSNTTVVYGNSSAVSGNQYKHLITTFGPVTPSSSQDNISSVLMIRFFRNSGNAADTYPDKAAALSFDIHYETDMLGSRTEYSK